MITENCCALVEGVYTDDNVIEVITIILPPPELREVTKYVGELIARVPTNLQRGGPPKKQAFMSLSVYFAL